MSARLTEADLRDAYQLYRDPLFRFGYRMTGSVEVAEDMVHDVFVSLFRARFDSSRGSLKTYLYSAIRNQALKQFRSTVPVDEEPDPSDPSADALNTLIADQTADDVRRAVEALPLAQREAIILYEYEDLSLEEVAAILGVDVGAVKARLYRARERLRKILEPVSKGATR
jgi:RNA polymerase sigma-70 factor (ECF subfamily)